MAGQFLDYLRQPDIADLMHGYGFVAGDIMVAADRARGLSARNAFEGNLVSIERRGVTMIALVEAGVMFEVHLTPDECEELRLQPGWLVWLVIKTYSCHLVEPAAFGSAS